MKSWTWFMAVVLVAGCSATDTEQGDDPEGPDLDEPTPPPPDDFSSPTQTPPVDDGWIPTPMTATRFGVFYQVSKDVLDLYQSADGLPEAPGHAYLITQSHATAFASKQLADLVHRRADFYYAPAFDIWDASHDGWQTAPDATLRQWAYDFRDDAIEKHADLFTFNEAPTTTGSSDNVRVRIAKLLRWLHEPDAQGRQLWGVVYFTQKPSIASNWTSQAKDFFQAIDETAVALVVEYYHSTGYVCANSEATLASHYFSLRRWLVASGDPAKLRIADHKLTVLHSSRYEDGPSGWAGGDATTTSLARFQRALSRAAHVTRTTEGGVNRLAFGPVTTQLTRFGVQPRIAALFRWHYARTSADPVEKPCIAGYAGNCTCD